MRRNLGSASKNPVPVTNHKNQDNRLSEDDHPLNATNMKYAETFVQGVKQPSSPAASSGRPIENSPSPEDAFGGSGEKSAICISLVNVLSLLRKGEEGVS